eukprot:2664756-Rhodomonas_salina.1
MVTEALKRDPLPGKARLLRHRERKEDRYTLMPKNIVDFGLAFRHQLIREPSTGKVSSKLR